MNYRIEISPLPRWRDARGEGVKKQVKDLSLSLMNGITYLTEICTLKKIE